MNLVSLQRHEQSQYIKLVRSTAHCAPRLTKQLHMRESTHFSSEFSRVLVKLVLIALSAVSEQQSVYSSTSIGGRSSICRRCTACRSAR